MPRIFNLRNGDAPPDSVKVDRSTPYGNPFRIGRDGDRKEVCDRFDAWILTQPNLLAQVKRELKGKDLVCWCTPLRCHAETLLKIANE